MSAGVKGFMVPGVSRRQWSKLLALKLSYENIFIGIGLHPYFMTEHVKDDLGHLEKFLSEHRPLINAVGEIGLDNVQNSNFEEQHFYFKAQLILAQEWQLPVIIHHRKSHNQTIQLLKQLNFTNGGVIHGFSGSDQIAQVYVDMGFKLGIGGTITYPRANKTLQAIKSVGLEHLVLETDSPHMPLNGQQGKRNSPENIPIIAKVLANHLDLDEQDVRHKTTDNFHRVFLVT